MDIETFWNQAFLSCLTRLPPEAAKEEADKATDICICHWQSKASDYSPDSATLWQEQSIGKVPILIAEYQTKRAGNVTALRPASSESAEAASST